jgi:4-amino-4-deoxy-L-arabinose transferase-like glycosyltransferase
VSKFSPSNLGLLHTVPYFLSLILLLYFWATGLTNLDRFPTIHEDESWQAAPGYTFWAEGRFGTDLFAGFYGMERHYYGFMPLFPILVGGALHLFGLGLFQARLVPLALMTLILALTHRLGTKLFSPWHGALAVAILVTWRIAGPFPHLVSGIPLADVARIVRYDSAVPVFGLAALLLLIHTLTTDHRVRSLPLGPPTSAPRSTKFTIHHSPFTIHRFFFTGFLTGLAALSHVYGAFWLPALLLAALWVLGRQAVKLNLAAVFGFGLALTPWFIFVASAWSDFLGQNRNYAGRFGLLDGRFYLTNLLNEVERYDPILNGAKQSFGAWLWLVACSLSLAWIIVNSQRLPALDPRPLTPALPYPVISARILLAVLATLGGLFALLLSFKTFSYLATLWPLFALTIAAGFIHAWQAPTTRRWWRPALSLLFLLALAEGIFTHARLQLLAQQTTPYQVFSQTVAAKLPPQSRVLGLQHYWLGLAQHSQTYQSILVPIFWTSPLYVSQPLSFAQAIQADPPQVILLDQTMLNFLAETTVPNHPLHQLGLDIWAYLAERQAQLIGRVDDSTYGRMEIYEMTTDR